MIARSPVYGTRGMVVSGHPLASLGGWQTLEQGGSVADAAIAAAAVLAVALPQACTLGGDALVLIHGAGGSGTVGLNASGPAPAEAEPRAFADGIPQRGIRSVSVPGVVGGWEALHRRHGRLPWPRLFERAIELAEDGVPVSRTLAQAIILHREMLEADPACRALLLPGGAPLAAGAVLQQPALAATLRAVAQGGSKAFYEGWPAEALGRLSARHGGLLAAEDLRGYAPEWVEPIETRYRDLTVRVMPPNSFGLLMLLQLNALAGFDLAALGPESAERLALLVAAARAAFAEGRRFVADPRPAPAPVRDLLGPRTTARLREAVSLGVAAALPPNPGGTAVVSVADRAGSGVTLIQSVFLVFGSGVADPETGIVLNNRMIGFTTEPEHPNQVAPGKRPAHTLNPVMAFRDGRLRYLLGTPGGPGQTLTLTQVLVNLVDHGMDLARAVTAPRWSMDLGSEAIVEADIPDPVVERLRVLGQPVERARPGAPFFGSAEAIEVLPNGVLCGAADHRRDAHAVGA